MTKTKLFRLNELRFLYITATSDEEEDGRSTRGPDIYFKVRIFSNW